MKLTNEFYIWFRQSTRRLINSNNNVFDSDTMKPQPGIKAGNNMSLVTASAEEKDFLNINEWMRTREDNPPVGQIESQF